MVSDLQRAVKYRRDQVLRLGRKLAQHRKTPRSPRKKIPRLLYIV